MVETKPKLILVTKITQLKLGICNAPV